MYKETYTDYCDDIRFGLKNASFHNVRNYNGVKLYGKILRTFGKEIADYLKDKEPDFYSQAFVRYDDNYRRKGYGETVSFVNPVWKFDFNDSYLKDNSLVLGQNLNIYRSDNHKHCSYLKYTITDKEINQYSKKKKLVSNMKFN